MLNGYFGYLANEILKRNKITYNDMLDILLYAAYEEERLKLDEYDNILFKNISSSLYQQGIEEISSKKSKYKGIDDDLLLSFLMIPIDGVIYSEYVKALSLTNSQEIKKLGISYMGNGNKVNVYDELFDRTLKKQRNRLICISENGISGRLDLQCTTLGNYSYLQAGIDTNTRYVKFVSDFCENVTKMCSNMDGIIFDIKGDNKFHRWWGHDSKHLTYEEIKCFGLIQGINMPPIMQHFHWCHSTLTYQTELSTDEIRKLMKNGNIKDEQPIESFINRESKKYNEGNLEKVTYNKEEERAFNYYISPSSIKLNEKLRKNIELDNDEKIIVDNLDRALNKTPNYEGNIVRTMQMDNPYDFIDKLKLNKKYSTNQYLSFSNKEGYNPNANIKIYISNSTKGKNLTKINKIGENEVLYQRNKEFRTLNITEKNGIIYVLWEEL